MKTSFSSPEDLGEIQELVIGGIVLAAIVALVHFTPMALPLP